MSDSVSPDVDSAGTATRDAPAVSSRPPALSSRTPASRSRTLYNPDLYDTYYHAPLPASSIPAITKLNGRNYRTWATNMELVLRRHQVWDLIQDILPPIAERSYVWEDKDLLAKSEILWSCEPDVQTHLSRCITAKECWDTLRLEYTVKDYIELRQMSDEFNTLVMLPNETCKLYIDRVKLAAEELATAGRSLDSEEIAYRLLFGLPDDYRPLRTSLLSTRSDQNKLSTSRVIPAILSEERHISNMSKRVASSSSHPQQQQSDPSRHGSHTAAQSILTPQFDRQGPQRTRRTYDNRQHPYQNPGYRQLSCTFCLGYNHSEETCFLKYPEKHPNHPKNRAQAAATSPPASSSVTTNSPASPPNSNPLESRISNLPSLESRISIPSTHHAIMNPAPAPSSSSSESSLRFEYNYYAGPPGIGNGCCDWMLDSGTTSHFTKWKHLYRFFNTIPPINIDTAGSSSLTGQAIGSIPLSIEFGEIMLTKVIYAPQLHTNCNLLSMAALDADGLDIKFSDRKAYITRRCDNVLWATGSLRDNSLYFLDTAPQSCNSLYFASPQSCNPTVPNTNTDTNTDANTTDNTTIVEDTQLLETWHRRLGHLGARNITRLLSMSKGIKIGSPSALIRNADCVDCLKSGQHRIPSHLPTRQATKKLQLVHSDICGPMRAPAIGGKEIYFATFIDDFSRMTWVYALEQKSNIFPAFQNFVAFTERECTLEKVIALRTDNAGEYISIKMQTWCADRGIVLQPTQPYSPDMNGVAERMMRSIVQDASAMLWGAHLGIPFWYEAVKTAVYLKNRKPHAARDKTPFELWTGNIPSLAHLRIFGCRCFALIPDKKRTKWESHSNECLLMGYFSTHNLFRLYDLVTNSFIKRRDVIFHECVVGHHGFANNRLPMGLDITDQPVVFDNDDIISYDCPISDPPNLQHAFVISYVDPDVPKTLPAALSSSHREQWTTAMLAEIASLERNKTWSPVSLPPGKSALACKWVFALRPSPSGQPARFKARLVARGDLQFPEEFQDTFAPVAKLCSLKILLSVAAAYDYEIDHGDFDSAFVNGTLDEEIYLSQPPGFSFSDSSGQCQVLRLHKSLYGLKQAARVWYQTLDTLLQTLSFVRVRVDYGVWVRRASSSTSPSWILVHVDDTLIIGPKSSVDEIKNAIGSKYSFKDLGPVSFFLGIQITRDRVNRKIYLDQRQYTSSLISKYKISHSANTPITTIKFSTSTPFEMPLYQAAIGSLLYLALASRPDIAFAVIKLSQFSAHPTLAHWDAVLHIMQYLYGSLESRLTLTTTPNDSQELVGYFDSSYADDTSDRHSTCGYVFYFLGGPISWRSKKQDILALSSTEAEFVAATEAAKESQWITAFLREIGFPLQSTILLGDNKGANSLTLNPMYHSRTKHIDVRYRYITELSEAGIIRVAYCRSRDMIADILTKPLPRDTFNYHKRRLLLPCSPHIPQKRHGLSNPPFTCDKCSASFSSRNALFLHLQSSQHFMDHSP